jgi:hypothetical protein
MRLLVVEDNPKLARLVRLRLTMAGFAVDLSLSRQLVKWRATVQIKNLRGVSYLLSEVE